MPEPTNDAARSLGEWKRASCLRCRSDINFVSRVQTARWLSIPPVCDRGDHDRPVSSTIRAERLRALFHSLPKGPFHLSFTLLLRCRSWSSLFSLRRWTPARLHSTLKLRDSSPGRRLITVACACDPYPDPSARSAGPYANIYHTGPAPSAGAAQIKCSACPAFHTA
jgi:hypothetical protein